MSESPSPVRVEPLAPATLALLVAALRKLSHDMNNAVLSSTSLLEMTAMDHPEAEPWLAPLLPHAQRPKQLLQPALRALPTRAAVRPRTLADWPQRIGEEAAALQVNLELPAHLQGPAALAEDEWLQCLDNLVCNALQAHAWVSRLGQPRAAPPWVEVQRLAEGHWRVCDNGPGCTDLGLAARGTPRQGNGHLGLGLAVVASHLQRLGGSLHLAPRDGGGLQAELSWPTT